MRIVSLLILFLLIPLTVRAEVRLENLPSGVYKIDPTHASLTWRVSHMGLSNYTARFKQFDAVINLDTRTPDKSTLTANINPMSIETDYPNPEKEDFNKTLATGEQWFNAGAFPKIDFVSHSIEITSENTGAIHGTLTMLGISKPWNLDVIFNGAMVEHPFSKMPVVGFSAAGIIQRSEWGMNGGLPHVGDDVEVIIEGEFHMQPEKQ
jgi:polyisoprenoid-binding protein YceI